MAIVKCTCGFQKNIDNKHLGKKVTCPNCKSRIIVIKESEKLQNSNSCSKNSEKKNENLLNTLSSSLSINNMIYNFNSNTKKITIITIVLIIVAISFTAFFDNKSDDYFDKALKQAAASFVIAKTLNAAVSVIQDVEISAQPFGFGMAFCPGEALDPANDMIERFSTIIFASTISLGVQKLISEVGRCSFVKISLLAISTIMICFLAFSNLPGRETVGVFFVKLFIIFCLLRFAMPIVSVINKQVYESITEEQMTTETNKILILTGEVSNLDFINKAIQEVNGQTKEIQNKQPANATVEKNPASTKKGFKQNVEGLWNSAIEKTGNVYHDASISVSKTLSNIKTKVDFKGVEAKIEVLKNKIEEASSYLVDIAMVFVFQTILSPLIVLWGLLKITGFLIS